MNNPNDSTKPFLRGLKTFEAITGTAGLPGYVYAYKPTQTEKRPWMLPRILVGLVTSVLLALPAFAQKSQSYTLTVIPAPCAVTITTATVPQAQASIPYSFQFAATSTGGCSLPLVFTASTASGQTGLPSGLTLSASGLLSGTIPATYCSGTTCPAATFTLTVKDQSGVGAVRGIVKNGKFVASVAYLSGHPNVAVNPSGDLYDTGGFTATTSRIVTSIKK